MEELEFNEAAEADLNPAEFIIVSIKVTKFRITKNIESCKIKISELCQYIVIK